MAANQEKGTLEAALDKTKEAFSSAVEHTQSTMKKMHCGVTTEEISNETSEGSSSEKRDMKKKGKEILEKKGEQMNKVIAGSDD